MTNSEEEKSKLFNTNNSYPEPGSAAEKLAFQTIQKQMIHQFEQIFPNRTAPRTIVILPSLTLDQEILAKVKGSLHYEERMLCLLMLLRMPNTKVIYLSSVPISETIIDYYLHLLPGITGQHARKRLTMINCFDASIKPLTQKILVRPRLIEQIKTLITDQSSTHLTCYNITELEKTLAVRLNIPMFGTDPDKFYEGSKSGSRKNFKEAGVKLPDGFEDLHSKADIITALAALKRKYPALIKAVIKMNDGFSGDGNAIFRYPEIKTPDTIIQDIEAILLSNLKPVVSDLSQELFLQKFNDMGGIVEEFLEGEIKMSPSVQCIISPTKEIDIVSTHDQLLGGDDGQVFIGAIFPADEMYAVSLAIEGRKVAERLVAKGVMGRFAIDFISVKQPDDSWQHFAIEINLRKGGTTHPYLMLKFLTDGKYNADTGEFLTASGNKRFYFASDNVSSDAYKGLSPDDLIEISMYHQLIFDGTKQEGVMFHLIGALSEFGKLGLVCIGNSPWQAKAYYDKTIQILDDECSS